MTVKIRIKDTLKKLFPFKNNPGTGKKAKKLCQSIFGLGDKPDPKKYLKSPDLDQVEVATALARLETELAWIKRILWLAVIGGGASRIFG
ncbi:unnamed protein product [marine sediment metagenome]|uniref:Uncharacterized protein n=1 Tax=marine sediment metagenome TaxID=412755 RepID=X1T198_9ZZZZ